MIIRVADLETSGFVPPDAGVCEIAWQDVRSTLLDLSNMPSGWEIGQRASTLVNPGHPIPAVASAIHHIVDVDVARSPLWPAAYYETLFEIPTPPVDVWCAHNAKFERQWITDELTGGAPWVCTHKGALRVWPDAPAHSNQALRYWRRPVGLIRETASGSHRAGPDAYVTAHLLLDLLEHASLDQLIDWSSKPALLARCHIGKEVDSGFMRWVLDKDFDEDVKFTCKHWLEERAKKQEARLC